MAKIIELARFKGTYAHWCPGCKQPHTYPTSKETARGNSDGSCPLWQFNGNFDSPSFMPSMNIVGSCHYFVTNGKIIFQNDCAHDLKGTTHDLVEFDQWPDEYWREWGLGLT